MEEQQKTVPELQKDTADQNSNQPNVQPADTTETKTPDKEEREKGEEDTIRNSVR